MTPVEESVADMWATGVSPEGHPTLFFRDELTKLGVVTSQGLWEREPSSRVMIAGVVTHRQRPMTAQGVTFLNLEDETGLINVVVSRGCWTRFRKVARGAPAMLIRGRLERSEGVINVVADHLSPLPLAATTASRDFRSRSELCGEAPADFAADPLDPFGVRVVLGDDRKDRRAADCEHAHLRVR